MSFCLQSAGFCSADARHKRNQSTHFPRLFVRFFVKPANQNAWVLGSSWWKKSFQPPLFRTGFFTSQVVRPISSINSVTTAIRIRSPLSPPWSVYNFQSPRCLQSSQAHAIPTCHAMAMQFDCQGARCGKSRDIFRDDGDRPWSVGVTFGVSEK